MTEELKPCPFKHKDGEVKLTIYDAYNSHIGTYIDGEEIYKYEHIRVVCQLCDARGPIAYKAKEAIKLWNARENK